MRASRCVSPAGKRVMLTTATTGLAVLIAAAPQSAPAQAPEASAAAWRVECSGDGKALECRAVQQVFQRETDPVRAVTERVPRMDAASAGDQVVNLPQLILGQ